MSQVDENLSIWVAGKPPYLPEPALQGELTCDVCIVGGGFTGVSTAWHIAQRSPATRIVLLEAA